MDRNPIPDDLRRFILMSGLTVPHLEALLILREHPETAHRAAVLASRLYIEPGHAEKILVKLLDLGAVAAYGEDGFVYRPGTDQLGSTLDALLTCYTQHLVHVSQWIHSAEHLSAGTQSAQAFADAFRIRKET